MTTRTITFREDRAPAAQQPGAPLQRPARLADLVFGVWAITPSMLHELQAIYEAHARGPKIDLEASLAVIEAKLGRPLQNDPPAYTVQNGVALLPVEGVIAPKANMFMRISGGASAQMLAREMRNAGADPSVKSIIQILDTPGGNVLGIPEYAQAVREVALAKPVVTFTDGQMASAGYWVGSAGNHIYASGPTVEVGSIGVIATHRDVSAANEQAGVKVTHITAGKYKALGTPHAPLSKADRASLQEAVDYCYSLFVDAVAAHRGVSADVVLENMADGRVFRGQQALDAGLVDDFTTLDALVESMATDPARYAKRTTARIKAVSPSSAGAGAARADSSETTTERTIMADANTQAAGAPAQAPATVTVESLQRDYPTVHAAILAAGAAGELARIKAVREQVLRGHEALIDRLTFDGKTTGPEAAVAVLAAERAATTAAADAHRGDAPNAARNSAPPVDAGDKLTKDEQVTKAKAYAAEKGVDFITAMKALGFAH